MWIENAVYIITFVISSGLAALGILLSFQLNQQDKKPVMSLLLYQQIFFFSFLIYSVWGNAILRIIISDLNLSESLNEKLAVFIPMIGIPFMVVSWFMLLRFAFSLNGLEPGKALPVIFFPLLIMILVVTDILIYKKVILVTGNADQFIVRILSGLNLVIHVVFLFPFFSLKRSKKLSRDTGFGQKQALFYFLFVLAGSICMSFFNLFGYISAAISIILLFGSAVFIPVSVSLNQRPAIVETNMDFESFCAAYEISRREAEVIIEICNGKSNKAIADALFITLQTVKDHNHRIFTKTGVSSRVQLTNLVREKTQI